MDKDVMIYKFTPKLNRKLRKWIRDNGFFCTLRYGINLSYQVDTEDAAVLVPHEFDLSKDEWFHEHLSELGYCGEYASIVLDVLHELGHDQTMHLFSGVEIEYSHLLKDMIPPQCCDRDRYMQYWNTPIEHAANLWLIMYVKLFPRKVSELEEIFTKYGEDV